MAKQYFTYDAIVEYPQVFERNKDHGGDDNDAAKTVKAKGGQTKVTMIVTEEVKDQMIADGVPAVSLGHEMFKPDGEGNYKYIAKRPWNSPFKDEEGEMVIFGPPNVVDYNKSLETGETVQWDDEVNIGNGSKAKVKLFIWKNGTKRIVRLEGIAVMELVEYEAGNDGEVRF